MDNETFWKFLNLIQAIGWPGGILIILVYIFVLNPEKGERFLSLLAKLFSKISGTAEKVTTAQGIQSKINSFIKSINSEVENLLPYRLKIKWISEKIDKPSFIKDGRVIVMLKYHQNWDENLSRATLLYMKEAVIPEARQHIHFKLSESIDLMMTKKALYSFAEARSSFNYFLREILHPKIENDTKIKDFCTVIANLEERGLFTRVLLRELKELGYKRAGLAETGDTVFETGKFTKFLTEIAQKERGENVPLTFVGRYIKIAVILVARPETEIWGIDPFIRRIREKIKERLNVIYIFARGKNIELAKEITKQCEKMPELVQIHKEEEFPTWRDGDIIKGYCTIFYNRKSYEV
jgi:small subunit ribosomal protein S1